MTRRMDMAQIKGCDGIEPDNVDAYTSDNKGGGFKLTYNDQLKYNTWLAQEAHARDLSIGLKNDVDQIDDLVNHFDWALNEECWQYEECDSLLPFIDGNIFPFLPINLVIEFSLANKAVFNCEYKPLHHCSTAIQMKISSIQGPLALDGTDMKMCNRDGQLVPY